MPRQDPEKLAAALRANLRRRKDAARAPEPSFGADEEGDVAPSSGEEPPGAWVEEASPKR